MNRVVELPLTQTPWSYEKIEPHPDTVPLEKGRLQGVLGAAAPKADSTTLTPLKSPLGKRGTI